MERATAQQVAMMPIEFKLNGQPITANQIDVDFAKIAIARSKNDQILNFARTMLADHQAVIDQATALVTKLKVTPMDNDLSKKLNAEAVETKKKLNEKSDKDFDKAYIDNEVDYHKEVISTVEDVLIPQAQNADLKALLQKVLPTLETHLEHAEVIEKAWKY
jgi:putative membrane protein